MIKINDSIHEYHLLGEIWSSKWLIWYFTLLFLQEITLKWLWTTITVFPMLVQYYWDTRAFWGSPDPQRFSIFQAKSVQRIITKSSLLCSWQNFWQIHGRKKLSGHFSLICECSKPSGGRMTPVWVDEGLTVNIWSVHYPINTHTINK